VNAPRPLKRVSASDKDRRTLQQVLETRTLAQAPQPPDYRDKVVRKPWGYEFLIFENRRVAVWFLHIQKDHATSMHCHPNKRTALSVLSGKALCNTFHQRHFLSAGDAVNLDPGVFHASKAMALEGVLLLETESPNAKSDLVRLEDSYGRQGHGYEGLAQMGSERLEEFHHFSFQGGEPAWKAPEGSFTYGDRFSIGFEGFSGPEAFAAGFTADHGATYNVCLGELLDAEGRVVAGIGQAERGSVLTQVPRLRVAEPILLLKIRMFT